VRESSTEGGTEVSSLSSGGGSTGGAGSGATGAGSGATGAGSGATGAGSGATGAGSGATGAGSGATGARSGATGVGSGGDGAGSSPAGESTTEVVSSESGSAYATGATTAPLKSSGELTSNPSFGTSGSSQASQSSAKSSEANSSNGVTSPIVSSNLPTTVNTTATASQMAVTVGFFLFKLGLLLILGLADPALRLIPM